MTKKIFRSIFLTAAIVLLASFVVVTACLYRYFGSTQERQLKMDLDLAARGMEQTGESYLEGLKPQGYRITWVASDGTVLSDTQAVAETLENHAGREEIQQALAFGEGGSFRYSNTLMEKTLYRAKSLEDGTVLRMSVSHATVLALALGMLWPLLLVAIFALLFSLVLARWMTKRIVDPLGRLDLDDPLSNDVYEELSPLLTRIHQQRQLISTQLQELREKTDEFVQITGSLNEGLILLDSKETILSINPAAQRLFHTDSSCCGKDFLTLDRSHSMNLALQKAKRTGHGEYRAQRDGREYQFDISQINSDGAFIGTVLLAFDVTEQAAAERSRREFTANVSHELKTPLQSIIGSAELLENNLVKKEDFPRFVGHIHNEAARLVTLIEDILRLSQLDEGTPMPHETIDLYSLAKEVASGLQAAAEAKNLQMSVTGESTVVNGVRVLLHEMLYNLCDNAIKYNVEGGSVELCISHDDKEAVVSVRDTGIGIPPEYQPRVFERFFRVDKSRSKASGGTGLGLSIVKHTAQYHHAKTDLISGVGTGTEISVTFPVPSTI